MERLGVVGCRAGDGAAAFGRRCGESTVGTDDIEMYCIQDPRVAEVLARKIRGNRDDN